MAIPKLILSNYLNEFAELIASQPKSAATQMVPGITNENLKDSEIPVLDADKILGLKLLCKAMGFEYPGSTFSPKKEKDAYKLYLPRVTSDGSAANCSWGGKDFPLSGDLPGAINQSFLKIKVTTDLTTYWFNLPISLNFEGEAEHEKAKEALSICETWEEVRPLLREQISVIKLKEILETKDLSELEILECELKQKDSRDFWVLKVKVGDKVRLLFASNEIPFKKGTTIKVGENNGIGCLLYGDEVVPMGGFQKLAELAIKQEYKVIAVEPAKGDYGGYVLTVEGVGLVSSNKQFERYYEAIFSDSLAINTGNPILITVRKVIPLKNGHKKADLQITMGSAEDALDAFMARFKSKSEKSSNTSKDPDKVESATVSPKPEVAPVSKDASENENNPVQSNSKNMEEDLDEILADELLADI